MKIFSSVIVLVAILGLLAFKNPGMENYNNYLRQSVIKEMQKDRPNPLGAVLNPLIGGIASELVTSQTIRKDYVFFSTYEVSLGKERLKLLGILGNFIILEKPDFAKGK